MGTTRVLHVITGLGVGGAESSLVRVLAADTDRSRHLVVSLTAGGARVADLEALGVRVVSLALARGAVDPRALAALRRVARAFRPHVIQGWMYHANLAATLLSLSSRERWPVVWNVRHALDAWTQEPRRLRCLVAGSRHLSWHPRAIVYNSARSAAQHAARGWRDTRALVIANGVDVARFRRDPDDGLALRASLGIPLDAPLVAMAARVDPLKDHATFIAAAQRVAAADRTVHFLLCGSGTDGDPALERLVREADGAVPGFARRLVRLGERRDMPRIFSACDVVVLTSRSEGNPNAIAEAMSCGVPCVVTDVADARTLVHDTGFVVPVGDPPAVAARVQQLLADEGERTRRGRRAAARIRAEYSGALEANRYQRLWALTAGHAAPRPLRAPRLLMVSTVAVTQRAFLQPIARHFRWAGWRVDALAAGATSESALSGSFDARFDAPWQRRPQGGLGGLPQMVRGWTKAPAAIRAVVSAGDHDLVHVHTPIAAWLTRFALRDRRPDVRVVYTAHGFHAYPGGRWWWNLSMRLLETIASRWTDALVVINEDDRALATLDELVPPDCLVHHCGIGVNTASYAPATDVARRATRAALGIAPDESVVAMVAEFTTNKRHADVLQALAILQRAGQVPPLLLCIGEGPTRPRIERLARELGIGASVRFLGYRLDVPALVSASDLLLLASRREGLPRCILEAMAMAVPVLSSDARGARELLAYGRGFTYPTGDVTALATALRDRFRDPQAAAGAAARALAWVRRHADIAVILREHEVLYHALLTGHAPAAASRAARHAVKGATRGESSAERERAA